MKHRYSPAFSSLYLEAVNTLDPFAMYTAFPYGYAEVLHRGLPAGDLNRPRSSPTEQASRVRVTTQPLSVRLELVVCA